MGRDVRRREVVVAALVAIVLSCSMNFVVVRYLTTKIPGTHDGLIAAWEMSRSGYAITHQPGRIWQSNTHYPEPNGMAFHDSLLGYGIPFGWIGNTPKAALIRFNLLFLFAYALAFFGAWLLARELGLGTIASAIAGAAYGFAPWRLSQPDHLHVLSSGGIPLSIALMVRGYRRRSVRPVIGGWLVATWQLSLGFTTGLMLAYSLAGLGVLGAGWWLVTRARIERRMVVATLIGVAVFAGWAALQATPYLRIAKDHPEATHSVGAVMQLSPPPSGFLNVPPGNLVWGKATEPRRQSLGWPSEQELFPGVVVFSLAATGAFTPVLSRWRRIVLIIAIAVTVMLSMGFRSPLPQIYQFFYDHAPGWKGIRTPGRLTTITTLALGVLAASGIHWWAQFFRRRRHPAVATAIGLVLTAGILLEGAGTIRLYTPPPTPSARVGLTSPQLHLPFDATHDMHYMFWSVGEFPVMANGHAVSTPRDQAQLRHEAVGFPDQRSVQAFRAIGIKVVVWHRSFAGGTVWERSDTKAIELLGITKRRAGDLVVFTL